MRSHGAFNLSGSCDTVTEPRGGGILVAHGFSHGNGASDVGSPVKGGTFARLSGIAAVLCALLAAATCPVAGACAQALADEVGPPAPPPEGLWPSPKLTNLLLVRWADQIGREYELDDEQREKVRDTVVDRWAPFLEENRKAIQPVVNEFLEMRLDLAPPEKSRVAAWAERAKPVFDSLRAEIGEGIDDIRPVLTPAQRARFELRAFQFGAAMTLAEMKLQAYQTGNFDPKELWDPPGHHRSEHDKRDPDVPRAKDETPDSTVAPEETDQITLEIRGWERFVTDFSETYSLDPGQRNAAASFLAEMTRRALAHRDRRQGEITELERRIADFNGSDADRGSLTGRLVELYGPIDEMFTELKQRVEALPTRSQRAAVKASALSPPETKPVSAESPKHPPQASSPTPGRR